MIITTIKIIINCIKQSNSGCIYIRVSSLAAVCCLWVVNCFFIIFLLCGSDPTCHLFCQHSDMSTHVCRCVGNYEEKDIEVKESKRGGQPYTHLRSLPLPLPLTHTLSHPISNKHSDTHPNSNTQNLYLFLSLSLTETYT